MSNNLSKKDKYITVSDAAHLLGISIDTIRRWDKSGKLHAIRLDGKNRYFDIEEIKQLKQVKPLEISQAAKTFYGSSWH